MAHNHNNFHEASKNMMLAFVLNLSFAIIEFLGGIFTNSVSIISDAIHDLGDSLSIGTSLVLEKKSEKHPDKKYTFGYRRYSLLGALLTSVILIIGSVFVILSSVSRLLSPTPVNYDGMLVLAVLGVIINLIAALKTSKSHSLNEKALSLHMFEDVLNWAAILIGSIIIKFTSWHLIDPILSLGITVFILTHAFLNLKEVFGVFLEKAPDDVSAQSLTDDLLKIEGVSDVHHIHIWSLDGTHNYLTLHAVVEKEMTPWQFEETKHKIREISSAHNIFHSTIELEFVNCTKEHCDFKEEH